MSVFVKLTQVFETGEPESLLLNTNYIKSIQIVNKEVLITIQKDSNEEENYFYVSEDAKQIVKLLEKAGIKVVRPEV